jgi:hypothetical protein
MRYHVLALPHHLVDLSRHAPQRLQHKYMLATKRVIGAMNRVLRRG